MRTGSWCLLKGFESIHRLGFLDKKLSVVSCQTYSVFLESRDSSYTAKRTIYRYFSNPEFGCLNTSNDNKDWNPNSIVVGVHTYRRRLVPQEKGSALGEILPITLIYGQCNTPPTRVWRNGVSQKTFVQKKIAEKPTGENSAASGAIASLGSAQSSLGCSLGQLWIAATLATPSLGSPPHSTWAIAALYAFLAMNRNESSHLFNWVSAASNPGILWPRLQATSLAWVLAPTSTAGNLAADNLCSTLTILMLAE